MQDNRRAIMAMVILLFVCGWISIINAQPNMVSLLPQEHQTVCPGESISYNCIGNGTGMVLFSPPIVTEIDALLVATNEGLQSFDAISDSAVAFVLVDPTRSPLFIVTYTVYISDDQSEEQATVICRVSSADGTVTANEPTFSVLGAPSPVTSLNYSQVLVSSSKNMTQVPVNVSWDSPENAQEFMLQIMNTSYSTTVRSLESSVTVPLPYGTYSATLCAINRCGQECRDYSNIFRIEPQQPPQKPDEDNNNSLVIAPAVVAGILGLFFILTFIYAVVVTVIICTSKKDKLSAQAVPADEMKMQ